MTRSMLMQVLMSNGHEDLHLNESMSLSVRPLRETGCGFMNTESTDVELSKNECLRNMLTQSSLAVTLSWMDFNAPNSKFQTEGAAYLKDDLLAKSGSFKI